MMNRIDVNSFNETTVLSMINGGMTLREFQEAYPTRGSREHALGGMSNEEIDEIINSCGTPQGKSYYASFKK